METRKNQRPRGRRVFNRSLRHTSLRSAHFYTGVPPVSPCALRGSCLLHSDAVRQAGPEKASPLSPSPSKGSIALAPLCGYPKVRMNVASCGIHPSHHHARFLRAIHHEGGC